MDASKTKSLKQNQIKAYHCTFQLQLFELRIFLRFPCKFFVEWKTPSPHHYARTQGFVQNLNGKVDFNQKLTLQILMLHDPSKKTWTRKDSTISIYLVTKNKPDFNQLVGRINIDLGTVCENNPYKKPITQSLTYSSASADLRFALNLQKSIISKKALSELDLHDFNEKSNFIKPNDQLNKSKSIDYLKNMQHIVSPVYQIAQSPISMSHKPSQIKPFHFPVSKLESYGHEAHQILKEDEKTSNEPEKQFNPRMTLGQDKIPLSRKDYDQMIQSQTKGMKKSNLMVVPDMKKNRVEEDDLEFNTDHEHIGSEIQLNKQQKSQQESDIDIVVDLSEPTQRKENASVHQSNIKTSINSSKSFSISRFKSQFEGAGQGIASVQLPTLLKKHLSSNEDGNDGVVIAQLYDAGKIRIKQLQINVSELVKMLKNAREHVQKLQDENKKNMALLQDLTFNNAQLNKKVDEWSQKASYESRINVINCEKLKMVSSQLTQQKRKGSKSQQQLPNVGYFNDEVKKLKQAMKKLSFEKESLEEKLLKRDEIELQNQVRIQQLQQELTRYRTQKLDSAPKVSPSALQLQSKIANPSNTAQMEQKHNEYISFLEEKIQTVERQNIKIKDMCNDAYKNIEIYAERDQRMKQNVRIIQRQFSGVIKILIDRQRSLKQKIIEIQALKRKSSSSVFNQSAAQEARFKGLQQELKKKDQMLQFRQNQMHLLEEQLAKVQLQNKELLELNRNSFRESIKYEGDLKVIKEEESYRESLASSGQALRLSFSSSKLNANEQSIVASYKEAVRAYSARQKTKENLDIEFTVDVHDLRWKAFQELDRSAKIINELLQKNQSIQTKLDEIQEQSAVSSNISPNSGQVSNKPSEQQITDQYSQATRKRSPIALNNEAKISREVQKLKSLLYDKSKEMNDLIASYQKLKLQKETQAMLMKNKKTTIMRPSIQTGEESDTELVHDLLDLQIKLNKEKVHKSQIMSELSIQKSLNKSQQISQHNHTDISQTIKSILSILLCRQNFITTEQSLNRLVARINQLQIATQQVERDSKLMYAVEEKARTISKEIQVVKSALFKMNFKELQPYQYKTAFANVLKPCQTAINELLASVEHMVNTFG